jgi:DNA-binding GntR family transcriptional regulator
MGGSPVAEQVRALSIVDAVAEDLRRKLFGGDLGEDAVLTEARVSGMYDIARPTARAAVERLVSEGLLVRGPHKTARVPTMGLDDVRDLYLSRRVMETEVVRTLASFGGVAEGLRAANDELRQARSNVVVQALEPTLRFHLLLVHSLGSPRMDRLFSILMGDMQLCLVQLGSRSPLRTGTIADEHQEIIEALAASDPNAAVDAMRRHLDEAEGRLARLLEVPPESTNEPGRHWLGDIGAEAGRSWKMPADGSDGAVE